MIYEFPFALVPDDNETLLATCPILPEVTSFGDTPEVAKANLRDAIEEAIGARMAAWEDMPWEHFQISDETGPGGPETLRISLLAELKLLLYAGCKQAGVTRAQLATRLGLDRAAVDRLFRIDHPTRVDQFDAAFAALGSPVRIVAGRAA
jgi:antitoxin HicB